MSDVERRLSAILSADAVGYTRLMAADEAATVRTIKAYRTEISNLVGEHRGRIVDATGDNALAEFPTALDAVEAAIEIQQVLEARNGRLPSDRRMRFRIGVHLGDVIVDGERIYGDGVNIAARLQALAEPGGTCLSAAVHEQVRGKLDLPVQDLGQQAVKNLEATIRVYQVLATPPLLPESAVPEVPSIAVLPFANLSADPDQEYFCDGLAEELINALARLDGLRVVARTSAFHFKGEAPDLREVGRKLGVKTVLEGSVRKSGDRLRINAQLINAEDGYHLWSERYDREMHDVFAVQDDISHAVVDKLKVELLAVFDAPLVKPTTGDLEAYEHYLRGRFYWGRAPDGPRKGIQHFERATAIDPRYAEAYAGIADCYTSLGWFGVMAPKEAYPRAEAAARQALELDDDLAEAHASLGYLATAYTWDWQLAEQATRRAVEARPSSITAHLFRSFYFLSQGDLAEAANSAHRALLLDPLSPFCQSVGAQMAWFGRRHDDAIEHLHKALEIDPGHPLSVFSLGLAYIGKRQYDQAIEQLTRATSLDLSAPFAAFLGYAHALAGHGDEARAILDGLQDRARTEYVAPDIIGRIYIGLGEIDQAFEWLEKGYEERSSWLSYITVDPSLDALRGDDRFDELVRRMNFPER